MLRVKVLPLVAVVAIAATIGAVPAAASGPSQSQIRSAVAKAERSKNLWTTLNACGPRRAPHTIGVRAQMPALGFPAQLSLQIQLDYWNVTKQRFVALADPNAHGLVALGTVTAGLQQGGESFVFTAHHGAFLRATVTFRWRRRGRLLLTAIRHTAGGHPNADQGMPRHFSAATCRIP